MAKRTQQFQTIRTEGAILPPDILRRIASLKVDGASPGAYHLPPGSKLNEAISQSWTLLLNHWRAFQEARNQLPEDDTATAVTNEKWLLPLFKELDYGRLVSTKSPEIDERVYPIERFYNHTPIHLIGCNLPLDRRTKGARGAATASPHSMVQEYLNRSDVHLWAFLSNGLLLRILRDNVSLSRQAYVEFDLEAMMEGEVYADFALLWLLCHQSRVEADKPEECWLEKWSGLAREQGTRVLNDLRIGVQNAIEALGRGFIGHPRNDRLREKLRSGSLTTEDYYRQLLRTVYRLLFLFVAEDRELLHPPNADAAACRLYDEYYSTRRLRDLALRIRGSKHADLWHSLSLVFDALGRNDGRPELGLCGLGSFLWRASSTADLLGPGQPANGSDTESEPVLITNDDLLQAIRALAYVEQDHTLRTVDYRNLGSEELGSVYESLLELHPVMNAEVKAFDLKTAAGNERKTTGSYYTPDSLVQCLLDSALDPVVEERLAKKTSDEAVAAILQLKVCDPACGSGHFLIAAAHRLARHLARARTGEAEPNPTDYQGALREIIGHCIYGVDINPMAVELCKVALWMEALEPGKPLSFLDHRIQCGNSLLGVTPALLAKGIPDDAFNPIEGDDKAVCKELKKRNKEERKTGQMGFIFEVAMPSLKLGNLPTAIMQLDTIDDDTIEGVKAKENRWKELVESASYGAGRMLADAWCAAFVWKKSRAMGDAITESILRRLEQKGQHDIPPWMREEIKRLGRQYKFLHWHLAFPDVFRVPGPEETADSKHTGWNGGFDVVLGNPPWEQVLLNTEEFFVSRLPDVAAADNSAARERLLRKYEDVLHPAVSEYRDEQRRVAGEANLFRRGGVFPLTGSGRINTYSLFAELGIAMIAKTGRVGIIAPSGILTDFSQCGLVRHLFSRDRVVAAFDFENGAREGGGRWFEDVHPQTHFVLLTLAGFDSRINCASLSFFCTKISDCSAREKVVSLSYDQIKFLSPNTETVMLLQGPHEAALAMRIAERGSFLGNHSGNSWAVEFEQHFNASSDSESFKLIEEIDQEKNPDEIVIIHDGVEYWPLHEAKLGEQFNHRFGTFANTPRELRLKKNVSAPGMRIELLQDPFSVSIPRYWVPRSDAERAGALNGPRGWQAMYRFSSYPENERTMISWIGPGFPCNHITPRVILPNCSAESLVFLVAGANSFAFDFFLRRRMSRQGIDFFILKQVPLPQWDSSLRFVQLDGLAWVVARAVELTYTAWDLSPFARDCAYDGPPFYWNDDRRVMIRCELDAAFFNLYLGTPLEWSRGNQELHLHFQRPHEAISYILETFPIFKRKEEAAYGSYRTKETILSIYDEMAEVIAANEAAVAAGRKPTAVYKTRLDPPPGPPADAAGKFLPLPEWKPGQTRPANWPRHIHAPRAVHEWAVTNGIDWRTLLEPVDLTVTRSEGA